MLVTHYQRLLNYIVPDYVHVMDGGRIIKTGGKELALELESRGYDWVVDEYQAGAEAVATAWKRSDDRSSILTSKSLLDRHARAAGESPHGVAERAARARRSSARTR